LTTKVRPPLLPRRRSALRPETDSRRSDNRI